MSLTFVPWSSSIVRPKGAATKGLITMAAIMVLILGEGSPIIGLVSVISNSVSPASLFRWRFRPHRAISTVRMVLVRVKV